MAASETAQSIWIPLPREVCRFFRRGLCQRVRCHYYHGTEVQLQEQVAGGARFYRPTDGATRPDSPSIDSSMPPSKADTRAIIACRDYLVGRCNHTRCRFVHLRDDVRHIPRTVCAYYLSHSGCKRGATRCTYFHGSAEALQKMHERGVALYNPLTNEPYDEVPENIEAPHTVTPTSMPHGNAPSINMPQANHLPQANQPPINMPHAGVHMPPVVEPYQHHLGLAGAPSLTPSGPFVYPAMLHPTPTLPTSHPVLGPPVHYLPRWPFIVW